MAYVSADEWAEKMHLTHRQVGDLLRAGKVPGAVKVGKYYRIPDVAVGVLAAPVVATPVVDASVDVDGPDPPVVEVDDGVDPEPDNRTPAEKARDAAVLKAETSKALREAAEDDLATKHINTEMAELEQREQDIKVGEELLTKRIAEVDARDAGIQKREDAVAVRESSIELATENVIQDAKDKATGIIGNATLQAGNLVLDAKEEVAKINAKLSIRQKELGKAQADLVDAQTKVTASRAVVERCLSRIDRDTKALPLYPAREWVGRLKELTDFVTSSLQDGS